MIDFARCSSQVLRIAIEDEFQELLLKASAIVSHQDNGPQSITATDNFKSY